MYKGQQSRPTKGTTMAPTLTKGGDPREQQGLKPRHLVLRSTNKKIKIPQGSSKISWLVLSLHARRIPVVSSCPGVCALQMSRTRHAIVATT